jgi:NADPH:quinone reductase-like Zn-dependent oxidoreductase
MKAYQIDSFGTENLEKADLERPEPGPDQLLLEMQAASLNYRDYMMVEGTYNPNQSLPLIPLSDGVGEVIQTGSDVDSFETGDRGCPLFFQDWKAGQPTVPKLKTALGGPLDGTLREYMVVDERGVASVPDYLSNEAAATLPCAALTAWHALFEEVPLKSGQTVLCLGTGGVSLFALQLAKAAGANVIITSSSDKKLERAAEFGADHTINYKKVEDWGAKVKIYPPARRGSITSWKWAERTHYRSQ